MFMTLFNQYWWLVFPLGSMVAGVVHMVLRDEEKRRTMALIRTYTDQGKDVPPELFNLLKR